MTRDNEENGNERARAFIEAVLEDLTDSYLSLTKRWPEEPPEFDAWKRKSCAYLRRMVTRLRAGSMESPDSRYTAAQMAEIIEKIEEYQSERRPLEAEFRKAEAVEARLCLRDEGDALKEQLAKLIATKRRLSCYEGPGSRRALRKLDHALRNMGARRGKRVRTATEAYEAAYAVEEAENREFVRELKERYIYG